MKLCTLSSVMIFTTVVVITAIVTIIIVTIVAVATALSLSLNLLPTFVNTVTLPQPQTPTLPKGGGEEHDEMYRAPEMVDLYACSELDESVDVWALGGVFFALLYHVHPFQEAGNLGILSGNWRQALPSASASLTPASSQAGAAAGGARAETVGWVAEKYKPFHALFERMFTKV
eukprot:CAMPEP_0171730480 /NCGR_PEP_ID=MMETSP0991-20121206/28312_1 /TAXON_ID=483369 /ORGANISM="non described non described, Strain CCMP2098" /LENGTH=173 /DNA_ID=CAMNT_0012325213 /DNA_START=158 /DNA_END=676 /DNA_ORIENTATION=-